MLSSPYAMRVSMLCVVSGNPHCVWWCKPRQEQCCQVCPGCLLQLPKGILDTSLSWQRGSSVGHYHSHMTIPAMMGCSSSSLSTLLAGQVMGTEHIQFHAWCTSLITANEHVMEQLSLAESQVFHTLSIVTWEKILSISFNQHLVQTVLIPFKFQLSQVELRVLDRLRILQQHFLSSSRWESGWKGSTTAKFVPYMMTYMRALLNNLIRGWQHSMHWP